MHVIKMRPGRGCPPHKDSKSAKVMNGPSPRAHSGRFLAEMGAAVWQDIEGTRSVDLGGPDI